MQRVSSEIQPMLDGWRDAVTSEISRLHSSESDWIRDFSTGLSELREEATRRSKMEEVLRACYEKLAAEGGVAPKLVKKLEEQAATVTGSLGKMQGLLVESRKVMERTERSSNADKRTLLKATSEENAEALRLCAESLRASDDRARTLEAQLEERSVASRDAERGLEVAWQQGEQLRVQAATNEATGKMLDLACARNEEDGRTREALQAGVTQQGVCTTLLAGCAVRKRTG